MKRQELDTANFIRINTLKGKSNSCCEVEFIKLRQGNTILTVDIHTGREQKYEVSEDNDGNVKLSENSDWKIEICGDKECIEYIERMNSVYENQAADAKRTFERAQALQMKYIELRAFAQGKTGILFSLE